MDFPKKRAERVCYCSSSFYSINTVRYQHSHHVAADVASFAAVFYPYGSKPPFTRSVAAPFRKPLRYSGRSRVPRAYHDPACFVCSVVNALATAPLRYQSLAGKSVINTRIIEGL